MSLLTRQNFQGQTQKIWTYEDPIDLEEISTHSPRLDDLEHLLDKHGRDFSDKIYVPHWREVILAFPGQDPETDPSNLNLTATTSYHVQAMRKGSEKTVTPITQVSLILTSDDKLTFGIRGGQVKAGKANVVPGGHVQYTSNTNPLESCFDDELLTETGIPRNEVTQPRLIGHQTDPSFGTICFVFQTKTDHDSRYLIERHSEALRVYESAKASGAEELQARQAIQTAGYSNIDAWENSQLVFVNNDSKTLQKLMDSGSLQHQGTSYEIIDNSVGALMMHKHE